MTDPPPAQPAPAEPEVLSRVHGRLGHIILNRPRAINALNVGMVTEVSRILDDWAETASITTVLLTGAGERGLCAGGDIVSIYHDAVHGGGASATFWRDEYRMNARIHRYPKPFVAVMNGVVLGGGIGIAGHASHRIVTESSSLGMPETGIGFVPDVGGNWLLSHAPGELGTHLALTAGSATGADALQLGMADAFVPSERIAELAEALEREDADAAVSRFAVAAPASPLAAQAGWINDAYGGDDVGEIVRRLGALGAAAADDALALVLRRSPTALKATLAALRRARTHASLEETLKQDLRVSLRFLDEKDLAEGIRAQVIDKDRNPRWSPATLDEVDDEHIESLFAPLGALELDLPPA